MDKNAKSIAKEPSCEFIDTNIRMKCQEKMLQSFACMIKTEMSSVKRRIPEAIFR